MKDYAKPLFRSISNGVLFLKRQHHDWKVTVVRTTVDRFAYQTVYPYLSLYIIALGATATQLGLVNSLGMIVAGLLGPLTGWFVDLLGPKKIYLIGISLLAISYLTYGIAHSWTITIIAMMAYWLGFATSVHGCATICGNCLTNEDRATGMSICETVGAGLLGMAAPMFGAWLVTRFGGINAEGIRPLFFLGLIITIGTFVLVMTQMSGQKWRTAGDSRPNLLRDISQVLQKGKYLKRWLIISTVSQLPTGMILPFSQVFAHEIKGADTFILGAMVTGSALASIVFALPLGRLADKIGRKRPLYLAIVLFWISNLILVWAPNIAFLVIAGVMQGFYNVSGPISAAMERELVPAEQMGRWIGIMRFVRMLISAGLVYAAGLIWDNIGPQYVFLTFVCIDLVLRIPLLISMPETLGMRLGK